MSHPPAPTDRRTFETALLRLSRLSLKGGAAPADVFKEAGAIIATTLGVARVGIWMFLDEGRAIRCDYLYQHEHAQSCEGSILYAADFPEYFRAMGSSRVVPVVDTSDDAIAEEFRQAYLVPLGISAMLDAPIYRSGRLVGIVCHEHAGAPRPWTELEGEFASSVGDIAGRLCEEAARRRLQQTLGSYQAHISELQRISAMGRLAAGIAHDFNNVLAAIAGYTEAIREAVPDNEEVVTLADGLGDVAEGGRRLTKALLAYGRDNANRPRVAALPDILHRSQSLLRMAVGPDLELAMRIEQGVSRVFVDPAQVERILMNLTINAKDATPAGGAITITLTEAPLPIGDSHGSAYVLLEVRDTGSGMAPSVRARALEPFFTTKGNSGTGLGLAIVSQEATRAGGFVDIESEPGQGTAVRVYLPRIAAAN